MSSTSAETAQAAAAASPPSADLSRELADQLAWSAMAPHGRRCAPDDVDAALYRSRRAVLRTVAALRSSEEELRSAKAPRTPRAAIVDHHLVISGPRKALYPQHTTALFKTISDLVDDSPSPRAAGTERSSAVPSASPLPPVAELAAPADALVVWTDPRVAVAEKHRAAVEVVRPQIPVSVERSLHDHTRHLGAVKPYGLSRPIRRGDDRFVAPPASGIQEHYIDRMQCCRPSKGLYVYYDS